MNEFDQVGSAGMVEAFERNGFEVLRGICPDATIAAMRSATDRDLAGPSQPVEYEADVAYPGAPASRSATGGGTVRRLLDALARAPVFAEWACSPALTAPVKGLLGSDSLRVVRAHHNCIMTKHPSYSSATGWHQDIRYWSFRRPDLVNAWTALDRESRDNGGMRLIPGSHRAVFGSEAFDSERFFSERRAENAPWIESAVQVDLAPGDVLLFHAGVLHSAGPNRTAQRKRAVVFSYRDAGNEPVPGTRSAAREDLDPDRFGCL